MEWFLFLIFFLIIYFLPSIIASNRSHSNVTAIIVLNCLAGWTFLGWMLALIWALISEKNTK